MNNVPPTHWTGHCEGEAAASPSFEAELERWKMAFWVDDYVYAELLMLLAKHQILKPNPTQPKQREECKNERFIAE